MSSVLRRGSIAVAVFAMAAAAATGCNAIVGVGDYAVGDGGTQVSTSDGGGDSGLTTTADGGTTEDAEGDGGGTHIGKSDGGGRLGDPCTTNAQCTAGTCDTWCTQPCTTNAVCGMNSGGGTNYCVQNANDEFVCVPGCTTDADCQAYAGGATCQPISGVAESVCTASTSNADAGSNGISVGDPCTGSGACGQGGDTCNGSWCVAPCKSASDTSCGSNSLGVSNYCVENGSNEYICFPGCSTNADCSPISGTTCQPTVGNASELICAGTNGDIGDPCSDATSSPWAACTAGTCEASWCDTTCTSSTDTSCGSNSAGMQNYCVENSKNAFSCFPGCATDDDCAPYTNTFCQPINGGADFVCANSGGEVGDACSTNAQCTQAGSTCAGSWCTQSCASSSDTSCGTDTEGNTNYCVQDSTTLDYVCFPGCSTDADCTPYEGSDCESTGVGSQMVCSF